MARRLLGLIFFALSAAAFASAWAAMTTVELLDRTSLMVALTYGATGVVLGMTGLVLVLSSGNRD